MNQLQKMNLVTTPKGIPAVWEEGGAYGKGGSAILIGDMNGESKRALFVRMKGHLSNKEHALVKVDPNDVIVRVEREDEDLLVVVSKIQSIGEEVDEATISGIKTDKPLNVVVNEIVETVARKRYHFLIPESVTYEDNGPTIRIHYQHTRKFAVLEEIGKYCKGEWEKPLPKYYNADIIDCAIAKSKMYHCRQSVYTLEPKKRASNE